MAETVTFSGDPDMLAAEHALRLLEGDDLATAQGRMRSDPAFAEAVELWEYRFAALAIEIPDVEPTPALWRAIEARLANDNDNDAVVPLATSRERSAWRDIAAAAVGAALTGLLAIAVLPIREAPQTTPPAPTAPEAQLVAALDGGETGPTVATRVDPGTNQLAVKIANVTPLGPDRAPELWVVPAGGAPVSLGLLPEEGEFSRALSQDEMALVAEGATIAVTYEDRASAPHPAPTTDIVAAGQLVKI